MKKADIEAKIEIVSTFSIVVEEMNVAFNDYKELGRAQTAGEMSEKGFAASIRKFLLPHLSPSTENWA